MADKVAKNAEKHEETLKAPEKREAINNGGKEIKETSKELIEGISEVVEGAESSEFVEGDVSEKTREGKKKAPVTGIKGASAAKTIEKATPPTIEIMRIQISTQVKNEIRLLEKEAARMLSGRVKFNPSKLNGVVAKIRELKDILTNLAYVTSETLKGLWNKYVKGNTI